MLRVTEDEAKVLESGLAAKPAVLRAGESLATEGTLGYDDETGDAIVYLFEIQGESDNLVEVVLKLAQLSTDVDLYLFDKSLNQISSSVKGGRDDEYIKRVLTPGLYAVRLYNTVSDLSSFFRLEIQTQPKVAFQPTIPDPGADSSGAHYLGVLGRGFSLTVRQVIEKADADAYIFSLPEGWQWPTLVNISVESETTSVGSANDLLFEVYDSRTGLLETVDQTASGTEEKDLRLGTGTFIVVVKGYSELDTGNYTLTVSLPQ